MAKVSFVDMHYAFWSPPTDGGVLLTVPPIVKMDATLSTLKACKHLALSSNVIEKITGLKGCGAFIQFLSFFSF
jgi:hypothetical protein